jgi:O-methyltransferase
MKHYLKRLFNKFGLDIIRLKKSSYDFDISALSNNYDNLAKCYEFIFSKWYGKISSNDKRLSIMKDLLGTPPSEAYFIINSIEKTRNIDGDICEFGVAQGITSQLIANEIIDIKNKKLHLFDSFEGLPSPTMKDELKDDIFNLGSMNAYKGTMNCPQELVLNRLNVLNFPLERTVIHKGFIEDLINEKVNFPLEVSFAYIDFDFYEPIKIVLDQLHSITKKDSIIMIDDYDFFSTGVKTAVSEFLEQHKDDYKFFVPDKIFGCFAILTKLI